MTEWPSSIFLKHIDLSLHHIWLSTCHCLVLLHQQSILALLRFLVHILVPVLPKDAAALFFALSPFSVYRSVRCRPRREALPDVCRIHWLVQDRLVSALTHILRCSFLQSIHELRLLISGVKRTEHALTQVCHCLNVLSNDGVLTRVSYLRKIVCCSLCRGATDSLFCASVNQKRCTTNLTFYWLRSLLNPRLPRLRINWGVTSCPRLAVFVNTSLWEVELISVVIIVSW